MTNMTLTDAQIREAFDRRSRAVVPSDLGETVLATVAGEPQRWSWTALTTDALMRTPTRRTVAVLAGVALLLATMLAVALVGSHDQPLPGPGRGLAFISGGDLWVADANGQHPRRVWDLSGSMVASRPTWVDPNTLLVQESTGGVHAVDLQASTARLLQPGALLAISPDHRRVAIGLNTDKPQIDIIDIATDRLGASLFVKPTFALPVDPQIGVIDRTGGPHAWSPDGRWLLGQGFDTDVSATSGWIYQLDVETGEIHDLVKQLCCGLNTSNPVLSPDGSRVVYIDYHEATKGELCDFRCGTLWSIDPITGVRVQLTELAGSEIGAAFSPDGRWVAFAEYVGPGYDVSIVRADGTGRRRLTNLSDVYGAGDNVSPYAYLAWDADGSGVTFMRGASGQAEYQLWHVTLDGQLRRLGTITASEFAR
jgi:hypothetical protein